MFALLMAGIPPSDNEGLCARPAGIDYRNNVPYLFSVRNMFFLGVGYWPVSTPSGLV